MSVNIKDNQEIRPAIIRFDEKWYFDDFVSPKDINFFSAYKNTNFITRYLRKKHFETKFPYKSIWYNSDLQAINNSSFIIIFDSLINENFVKFIKEEFPKKRIVYWYWNPARNSTNPDVLEEEMCEKWSYSHIDCDKYSLKYNTTFYFKDIKVDNQKDEYDIFFVGKDKGRLEELLLLQETFNNLGLKTKFHISQNRNIKIKRTKKPLYSPPINYKTVLDYIGKSRAILDLLSDPMDGLSLRPMESIFHKKKLITNSKFIESYDFYSSNNIFILGKDNLNDLSEFLNSPYVEIDRKIVEKYSFESWISRF